MIELYHKSAEASIVDQTINKKSSTSLDVVLENAEVLNQYVMLLIKINEFELKLIN